GTAVPQTPQDCANYCDQVLTAPYVGFAVGNGCCGYSGPSYDCTCLSNEAYAAAIFTELCDQCDTISGQYAYEDPFSGLYCGNWTGVSEILNGNGYQYAVYPVNKF
ncbi:hypothetical protein HK405_001308, partial [Cladochytrium tenue]